MTPLMQQLGEQRCRRDLGVAQAYRGLFDARDFEYVLDQSEQVLGFLLGVANRPSLRITQRAEVAVTQHFQRRENRGKRTFQVMHDHLHEIVAHFFELAQLAVAVLERIGGSLQLEQAADARPQYETVVGLRQEIVAARLDAFHPVTSVVEGRDEYHWNARRSGVALDAAANLEPR